MYRAIVALNGIDHYLDLYGTKVSRAAYDRLVGEWLARGRVSPPKALAALRERFVEQGWARSYVNAQVARVKRMFKWAVAELVPATTFQALAALSGLRRGHTAARETDQGLDVRAVDVGLDVADRAPDWRRRIRSSSAGAEGAVAARPLGGRRPP